MMNKLGKNIVLSFTIGLILISCSSQDRPINTGDKSNNISSASVKAQQQVENKLSKIYLYDSAEQIIAEIIDVDELSAFYKSWKNKVQVNFIQQPELTYRLEVFLEGKKQIWYFDGRNIISISAKGTASYYQLTDFQVMKKYLEVQL